MKLGLLSTFVLVSSAWAVPFNITITNTGTDATYPWSTGLLTLSPTIAIGLSPQPTAAAYPTYTFANSNCDVSDSFCSGNCDDNGNAVVLAQRLGLTLGVNAWLVPALPAASNATTTVAIDVPAGSRLSYIAWINETSVFDDFVAMHPAGQQSTLSIPLFNAQGAPLANPVFSISGYDTNSTSPTDGSGATCSQECPAQTTGCYVAPGNASIGFPGTYPAQPSLTSALSLTASGPATTNTANNTYTFSIRNTSASQVSNVALTYTLPAGVTYVSSTNSGAYSATTRTVTWPNTNVPAGQTVPRSVTVSLGALGSTTAHFGQIAWTTGNGNNRRNWRAVSNVVQTLYSVLMTPAWTFTDPLGRVTDGLAVGDFVSGGNTELVVVLPASTANAGGASVVATSNGAQLSTFSPGTGRSAMGLPLADQLVAGGAAEYVFGEPLSLASNAGVYARNGNSTTGLWASIPYSYASYWNMGPSAADMTTAAGNEVLVADWDGNVRLLTAATGAVIASYNTWTQDQDHAFGHVALAPDLDADTTIEAVVAGYLTGTVIVLNTGPTLTRQWKSASLVSLYGDMPYGSGPAIGNIDGDTRAEIVVATYGTNSDIYAFDVSSLSGSTCEHRFRPGGGYYYTSPVIGDVDGSGVKSIVVMSSTTGVVSVMKADVPGCAAPGGRIVWQHTVKAGDRAAFTPVLYDVNGDGVLDVIVASNTRLEILDVRNRTVLLSYDDSTAGFSPSAVVSNADKAAATTELYVTGWRNSKLFRFSLPATATSTNEWNTFMGNNARTGAR